MPEGKKFRPVITRVKLNPEQAVLACCASTLGKGQVRASNRTQCTNAARCPSRSAVASSISS